MTYRLSMAVDPNICLEVECTSMQDLVDEFTKLGGDGDWLWNAAKASVARSLHGDPVGNVVRSTGASVLSDEPDDDPFPSASPSLSQSPSTPPVSSVPQTSTPAPQAAAPTSASSPANGTPTARPSDPWADETPTAPTWPPNPAADTLASAIVTGPTGPVAKPVVEDPWGADSAWPGEATVARDALTSRTPKTDDPFGVGTGESSPGMPKISTDKFGRRFTTGLASAPECHCGNPAAKMAATSKAGNAYSAWRCAEDAPGGDYTQKCDYSEMIN